MEISFFVWLSVVSFAAALAAQMREINGRRANWRRIAASTFFYTMVGVAFGMIASTQSSNTIGILGAVMAALLLRVDPDRLLGRLFPNETD